MSRVGAAGRVVAFEPTAATAATLRENVAQSGFGWVEVRQAALGARGGLGGEGLQLHCAQSWW